MTFENLINHLMNGYSSKMGDKLLTIDSDGYFTVTTDIVHGCPDAGEEVLFQQCLNDPNSLNIIEQYLTRLENNDDR